MAPTVLLLPRVGANDLHLLNCRKAVHYFAVINLYVRVVCKSSSSSSFIVCVACKADDKRWWWWWWWWWWWFAYDPHIQVIDCKMMNILLWLAVEPHADHVPLLPTILQQDRTWKWCFVTTRTIDVAASVVIWLFARLASYRRRIRNWKTVWVVYSQNSPTLRRRHNFWKMNA